jgi:hypothetical protein
MAVTVVDGKSVGEPDPVRRLSVSLSGYLCGTHSGLLAMRRARRRAGPRDLAARTDLIAEAHRALELPAGGTLVRLGAVPWAPAPDAAVLRRRLVGALDQEAVVELLLFGSQARGGTTGFSDVDAVLTVRDEAVEDPARLRALRPHVLAAERAILAYQPMQHHGLEIATPKLLRRAGEALGLPAIAREGSRSLRGGPVAARFQPAPGAAPGRIASIVDELRRARSWPRHPWDAHRLVSMFELLPVLYLQTRGASVPKWRSFAEAAADFPGRWGPYDALAEVRERWPRRPRPGLRLGASVARNPWDAVAAWRRLPLALPGPVRSLLSEQRLRDLQQLAGEMGERAR